MSSTPVGALLLEANLINSVQLQCALEHQQHRGGRTVGILVELGMLEHDQMFRFLARRGVPALNPNNCNVQQSIAELLPRAFVVRHEMVPIDRLGRLLTVAMVYPFDSGAVAQAEELTGLRVRPALCRANEFHKAVHRLYPIHPDPHGRLRPRRSADGAAPRHAQHTGTQRAPHAIARIQALQTMPITKHTKGRFSMLGSASGLNVERAAEILSRDPIALARVLSVANTREWTRQRPILDRHEAIRSLGLSGAIGALRSLEAWEAPIRNADEMFTQWRSRAVAVAETAVSIAKNYANVGVPGVYEAALLHDLGGLALLMLDTANYPSVFAQRSIECRHAREMEVYGLTAIEAGTHLARAWNLPEPIAMTIEYLLRPESAPSSHDTIAVTSLAHHAVQLERDLEAGCTEALRILGLTQTTLRSTILQLNTSSPASADEI